MNLTEQQEHELVFWRQVIQDVGVENYRAYREADFNYHFGNFQGNCDLSVGLGLEIGVGLGSLLEFAPGIHTYFAIDPLMQEFMAMPSYKHTKCVQYAGDGEDLHNFSDDTLDWVVCWNVIDHTPHPEKMVQEIMRTLKPGTGRLYLYLNFDDSLSPCHYELWRKDTVLRYFAPYFNTLWEDEVRVEEWKQTKYYTVMERK